MRGQSTRGGAKCQWCGKPALSGGLCLTCLALEPLVAAARKLPSTTAIVAALRAATFVHLPHIRTDTPGRRQADHAATAPTSREGRGGRPRVFSDSEAFRARLVKTVKELGPNVTQATVENYLYALASDQHGARLRRDLRAHKLNRPGWKALIRQLYDAG